jgi:ABC-type branched-subunit amino acid transport system ATPase component
MFASWGREAIMVGMKECNCDWARHWQKMAMRTMELARELHEAKILLQWTLDEPDAGRGEIEAFLKREPK